MKQKSLSILNMKYFNRILSYFIFSLALMSIMFFITTIYYINVFQSNVIKDYNVSLNKISSEYSTTIDEIMKTSTLLFSTDELEDVMFTPKKLTPTKYYILSQIKYTLSDFRATKSVIYNAYVFDFKDYTVISADGTSTLDEFYNSNIYNSAYKDKLFSLMTTHNQDIDYEILGKTSVYDNLTGKSNVIIPILQYSIDYKYCHSLLYIELNESYISNLLSQNKLTDNSMLSIYDKNSKTFYYENSLLNYISEEEMTKLISKNESGSFFKYNNRKYLFNHIESDNISYIAIVPYVDFIKGSIREIITPTLILLATIITALILSFIYSKKISNPVINIFNRLQQVQTPESATEKNEIEYINSKINSIIKKNKSLSNELSIAIPYVCERYLISILNNNETLYLNNSDINVFLSDHNFAFKYDNFVAITTNISFTKEFYLNHTKEDQMNIQQGILKGLKETFSYNDQIYVMSFSSNFVCSILNTNDSSIDPLMIESLKKFHKNLNLDETYIKIYSGVGSSRANIKGLFISYHESLKASSIKPLSTEKFISIYETGSKNIEYSYTISQEAKLINALSQGDKKTSFTMIKNIVDENINMNISETTLKKLYIQIYNTGMRVISTKNLSPYDILGNDYVDLMVNIDTITSLQIQNTTIMFIKKILNLNTYTDNKWDADIIKSYIEDNFSNDIYLDKIAEHFNVSAKYMSTIIKKTLGMSFRDYISQLRIEKAKQYLKNTNMTVNEIAKEIGFNSRHPFIRMFKLKEGVSPSTYRNINKNQTV